MLIYQAEVNLDYQHFYYSSFLETLLKLAIFYFIIDKTRVCKPVAMNAPTNGPNIGTHA